MNVLDTPHSEFVPSGEHAPIAVDAREAVANALASIAHEIERPIEQSTEEARIRDLTKAQVDLRVTAMLQAGYNVRPEHENKSDYEKAA